MILLIFGFSSFLLAVLTISFTTYYLQIKEYRLDRTLSYVREKGLIALILPGKVLLPKKSIRNRNIAIIALGLLSSYFILSLVLHTSLVGHLLLFCMALPLSIGFVLIGVAYTKRIVIRERGKTIREAQQKLNDSKALVIAITGSFGKSSTKEFLAAILASHFNVAKTKENFNTDIGIAMSINTNISPETKFLIAEIGAYKQGEIKPIVEWLKPTYAILTGLGNQHIDLFGSKDSLIDAKAELLKSVPPEGICYINSDSEGYERALHELKTTNIVTYSQKNPAAEIYAANLRQENDQTKFLVHYKNREFELTTRLLGEHNIYNLLPCIALALDLGVPMEKITQAVSQLSQVTGRLSMHSGIGEAEFLYDGYSSNVDGFLAAIKVLNGVAKQHKYIITKGIIELGSAKKPSYTKILDALAHTTIKMFTTDRLFSALGNAELVTYVGSETRLLQLLKQVLTPDSAVLIEGRFSDTFINKLINV